MLRIDIKFTDVMADVFGWRVAEKIKLELIRPDNAAVRVDAVYRLRRIVEKIRKLAFALRKRNLYRLAAANFRLQCMRLPLKLADLRQSRVVALKSAVALRRNGARVLGADFVH